MSTVCIFVCLSVCAGCKIVCACLIYFICHFIFVVCLTWLLSDAIVCLCFFAFFFLFHIVFALSSQNVCVVVQCLCHHIASCVFFIWCSYLFFLVLGVFRWAVVVAFVIVGKTFCSLFVLALFSSWLRSYQSYSFLRWLLPHRRK